MIKNSALIIVLNLFVFGCQAEPAFAQDKKSIEKYYLENCTKSGRSLYDCRKDFKEDKFCVVTKEQNVFDKQWRDKKVCY